MNRIIEVDVTLLTFFLGSIVPLLTALLTKLDASPATKAIVNLVLSLAAGTASYLLLHDGRSSIVALATQAIAAYLASGVTFQNFWKPTSIAPALQRSTRYVGFGRSRSHA